MSSSTETLPLPSVAALAQRGAVAPFAPWLLLLLRSSLVQLFAAAIVLLLRHEDSYLGGQNRSTLGSYGGYYDPKRKPSCCTTATWSRSTSVCRRACVVSQFDRRSKIAGTTMA